MSRSFTLIAAMTRNRGIGYQNQLPWKKFAPDLKFFKQTTMNQTVIMGRKTWESIRQHYPRGLPNRDNIILTRNPYPISEHQQARDLNAALNLVRTPETYIIGGQKLYDEAIYYPECQKLLITHTNANLPVDTYFPEISQKEFQETRILKSDTNYKITTHQKTQERINYEIVEYRKKEIQNIFFPQSTSKENEPLPSFTSFYQGEQGYLQALEDILKYGEERHDRTKIGTKSLFGLQMRFDLQNQQFPLLTTKRMFTKGIIAELLWFLSGSTDTHILRDQGVHIWDGNTSREFLDENGFPNRPEGDMGPSYSFQFRHSGASYQDKYTNYFQDPNRVDQVQQLVHQIKTDPNSRRHIINLWNVPDVKNMSLPPCLFLYQFYVTNPQDNNRDRYLNCSLYQRSADMGLGVPFNIASAALLTNIIAKLTDLNPGEIIHHIGDAHIYTDHIIPLTKQIQRTPRPFPLLYLDNRNQKQIEDFKPEDFQIKGYYPHPGIKMQMAV